MLECVFFLNFNRLGKTVTIVVKPPVGSAKGCGALDKQELNEKLEAAAKTIYMYCLARTKNRHDAQDLAQDILLEIYESAVNLRDESAFYGFMWGVAGNVYRRWCRKMRQRESIMKETATFLEAQEPIHDEQIDLLRRELALLAKKYREAAILYYVRNKSCEEISDALSISVSMVKYLLFKARRIVKEGMNMERHYGEQSYAPRSLELQFWGCRSDRYMDVCKSRIAQNILFACYQDKLTEEQISLEIGVMLPYMEEDLAALYSCGLLKREGRKYSASIVIFMAELTQEIRRKTADHVKQITDSVRRFVSENEMQIRELGFYGADMPQETFRWQMTVALLYHAIVLRTLHGNLHLLNREDSKCQIWAVERSGQEPYALGISNGQNENGDYIQFMDFALHGEMIHKYCSHHHSAAGILLDIAAGRAEAFSRNDWGEVAEMIERGYVISDVQGIRVNMPVFIQRQYDSLLELMENALGWIEKESERIAEMIDLVLKAHVPLVLRKNLPELAYLRLLEDGIAAVIERLVQERVLIPQGGGDMLPTTYIVLKD